ncbi:MAG: polysaccharide biosynthesis tyrosine autokinase [Chloroflexota bacterium]
MTESRQEGLDIRQWGGLIWRRKWLLLAIVVVLPVGVYLVSSQLPKTYQAKATVKIEAARTATSLLGGHSNSKTEVAEAKTLLKTPVVARRAAHILGKPPFAAKGLLGHISVASANPEEPSSNFISIVATASNPDEAAAIANAFAKALGQIRTVEGIKTIDLTIHALEAQRDKGEISGEALAKELSALRLLKASQANTTPIVEAATPPAAPISPKPRRNAIMALILALLVAAALAPMLDRFDRRIRNAGELEDLLDAPVLAVVSDDAFPGHPPSYHVRESFETLRASLTYFNVDRTLSSLVVASPIPQDGKTTVAINLAIAYALDERDVILIDGDLRRPQVAARLGKEVSVGLDSVLVGEKTLDEALSYVDVGAGRLRILPGATPPPNPAVLLGSQRMRMLLAELSEQVDVVLIDTPGLLACSDAIPLFSQVSGTVMVARLDRTPRDVVRRTRQVISSSGGTVLGSVVTGAHTSGIYGYSGGYYGYYGYYGSGNGSDEGAPINGKGRLRKLASGGLRRSRS